MPHRQPNLRPHRHSGLAGVAWTALALAAVTVAVAIALLVTGTAGTRQVAEPVGTDEGRSRAGESSARPELHPQAMRRLATGQEQEGNDDLAATLATLEASGLITASETVTTPEVVEIAAAFPIAPFVAESELVFGPTLYGFDVERFAQEQGGFLLRHMELVNQEALMGPEIVERVARAHGIGPRVLLALLEMEAGWLSDQAPTRVQDPLGAGVAGLHDGLVAAADGIAAGYYTRRAGAVDAMALADNMAVEVPALPAASWALLGWLSRDVTVEVWPGLERPSRFWAAWTSLYDGEPLDYATTSVAGPAGELPALPLALPFAELERWYYIQGPHSPRGEGAPRATVSFAPPPAAATGCYGAVQAVTAPLAGVVRWSDGAGVLIDPDQDGDGWEGTGWSIVLRHLSPVGRVEAGTSVEVGDTIGHPYCEDGTGQTRVSLARRYDGAWVEASRPGAPLVLGGWLVLTGEESGEGAIARPGVPQRTASPAKVDGVNDVAALP